MAWGMLARFLPVGTRGLEDFTGTAWGMLAMGCLTGFWGGKRGARSGRGLPGTRKGLLWCLGDPSVLVASWAPGVGGGAQGAGRGRGLSGGQDVWVGEGGVLHSEELGGVGDVGERGVVRGRGGRRGGQLASWEQVLPSGELLR